MSTRSSKLRLPCRLSCWDVILIHHKSSHTKTKGFFPSSTKPPSGWSKAFFTTKHKKDVRSNPSNYRPISLTCAGCTIMEHIMRSHISKHLSTKISLLITNMALDKNFLVKPSLFQPSMTG